MRDQQVIGTKSGILPLEASHGLGQKSRTEDQNQGERYFGDHQEASKTLPAYPNGAASATFSECVRQGHACAGERGGEAEQNRRD
jgi:hypothetical protein